MKINKNLFIFIGTFFYTLGGTMVAFSLIYRLADWFSFNPGQIGIFMAMGSFFFILGCNLYHRFGSLFEPIKIFPLAAIFALISSIALGFIRVTAVVYVSYFSIQICAGMFWPPVMAWLTAGLNEKNMNRVIGHFNRSWMSASMVGPVIAGFLYVRSSTLNFLLIIFSYSIAVSLFFLLRFFLRKQKFDEKNDAADDLKTNSAAKTQTHSPPPRTMDVKLDLYRYRGWISGFCSSMFVGILTNIVPLHIRDGLGYTEHSAGFLLFVRCFAGLVGFTILARFTAWHFNRKWFFIVQAGLILCSFFFLLAGNRLYLYFIIVFVYGLFNSASYNNSMFYSSITGKNPKKNLALHEIFMSIGTAAGSAGGGFFYQHFHFSGTCLVSILILGLGLAVQAYLESKQMKGPGKVPGKDSD